MKHLEPPGGEEGGDNNFQELHPAFPTYLIAYIIMKEVGGGNAREKKLSRNIPLPAKKPRVGGGNFSESPFISPALGETVVVGGGGGQFINLARLVALGKHAKHLEKRGGGGRDSWKRDLTQCSSLLHVGRGGEKDGSSAKKNLRH